MDATAAASTARVTVATIRTWCRRGVVTAVKRAGRWDVEETSLRGHLHTLQARRFYAGRTRPPVWLITHACGHETWLGWHALPGATDRACHTCTSQAEAQRRVAADNTIAADLAARYGRGNPATRPQLSYLGSLIRKAAAARRLPADCPTDHIHLLTTTGASHWIDTLKPFARSARSGYRGRCECASGRYGGACTCC